MEHYTRKDFDRTFEQAPPRGFYLVLVVLFLLVVGAASNFFLE